MTAARGTRALRIFLTVMGVVMVVAGSGTVVFGAASIVGAGDFTAAADSEMRFYAVWYVAAGAALLRAARDVVAETWIIRSVAAAFFAAGCSRALSWIAVGRPHGSQLVLLAIEVILPFVLLPWQASVARRSR